MNRKRLELKSPSFQSVFHRFDNTKFARQKFYLEILVHEGQLLECI